jgi:hypothetical protein
VAASTVLVDSGAKADPGAAASRPAALVDAAFPAGQEVPDAFLEKDDDDEGVSCSASAPADRAAAVDAIMELTSSILPEMRSTCSAMVDSEGSPGASFAAAREDFLAAAGDTVALPRLVSREALLSPCSGVACAVPRLLPPRGAVEEEAPVDDGDEPG